MAYAMKKNWRKMPFLSKENATQMPDFKLLKQKCVPVIAGGSSASSRFNRVICQHVDFLNECDPLTR